MKIAYLLKKFPRLSETFVLHEILMQERLGTEVHVFSRRPPDDEPRHPELAELEGAVDTFTLSNSLEPWLAMFDANSESRSLLERFGHTVRELAAYDHPRLPGLFAEALYLLRRTRDLGIEHVHVHFATDSALVAMILNALGGPSYSVTAHAKDIYRSTVDPTLLSLIVRRSSFTVTVCDANVQHLERVLAPDAMRRVRRLYNGIDLDAFRVRDDARRPDHVLSVGRLVEKKGFHVLLRALRLLRDRGVACTATLIGDGEERAGLTQLVADLELTRFVELTGALDQAAVREWMARATVFCQPCVVGQDGNRDALPTALLEAQAMGLPCISTPVTGIPEILAGGAAGVLVPENDVHATADAIQALLSDRARREQLSRAGRKHVETHFDARASAATLGSWFEEAVAAPVLA